MIETANIAIKLGHDEKVIVNTIISMVEYKDPQAKLSINSTGMGELTYNIRLHDKGVKDDLVLELLSFCRSINKKIEYSKSLGISENIFFKILDK